MPLTDVARSVCETIEARGWSYPLLVQGDASRTELLVPLAEESPAALREIGMGVLTRERIANARDLPVPDREEVLGAPTDTDEPGERLYALASRIPIGPADRYAVLAAPTAAERLTALNEAVDSVAAVIEFQLSE